MTTPALSIDPPNLEIHVLGGGKGESIVLKLPDGQWGVVDCHAESVTNPGANPTIRFLRDRGVARLLFVCLTHPHDDHYLGMSNLLEEFKPQEFWRFGCLSHEHVRKLLTYHELKARKAADDELSKSSQELIDIFTRIYNGAVASTLAVCRANSRMTLYPKPTTLASDFKIECLSPTGYQVERYEGVILACIGPDGRIRKNLTRSDHNDISMVLKITYGETKVILGGDLEARGWLDVIREIGGTNLSASAVKVSHHGSENGYCVGLWEHFSRDEKPVAVVTPRWRYSLPSPKALTHISGYAKEIHSTSQREPHKSLSQGGPPIQSRLKLRASFSRISTVAGAECGQCSLIIDNKGKVKVEIKPPAVTLAP